MPALIGLAIGALIALVLRPTVPAELTRYVAMGVVAAVDASVGGLRAYLDHTFNDRLFVVAFLVNAAVAAGLVWLGDQLSVDLTTAVAVVLGIRIFQNVAAIRRRVFRG
ncbi:MAG TPA: small basic family protein [Acidimicrobiales bacterium]